MIKNSKLQFFLSLIILLAVYKLFFFSSDSYTLVLINDIIIIASIWILSLFIMGKIKEKNPAPLSLIVNIGILNAFAFFIITFSDALMSGVFERVDKQNLDPGIISTLVSLIYVLIFFVFFSYVLMSFRELFFYKQTKNMRVYFQTMLFFVLLSSLSESVFSGTEFAYIRTTFFVVSTILIVVNSIRISWIAFINKKEKISLLALSVVISALFIVNLVNSHAGGVHEKLLVEFSPALNQFSILMLIYGAAYFSLLFFTTMFHIPTADVYDRKAQEVSSLQYFSKLITEVLDFDDLAETVTDITIKVSSADAAWILMIENGNNKTIAIKNAAYVDADMINQYLFSSKQIDNITDTVIFSIDDFSVRSGLSEKYGSILVSPLRTHNNVKGFLVASRKNELIFYEEDKKAIKTFSDYASVAIENSRLLNESIEKERLEKELDVAREIQKKILPSEDPVLDKLSVSSVFIPAFEVGGDYYDFFETGEDKFSFVIADVSGKGISAAFIMAEVKGIFQTLSRIIDSPKEILIKANQVLRETLSRNSFVSALYGIIDLKKEKLFLARAGHCPVLLVRNSKAIEFKPAGIGLGLSGSEFFARTLEEQEIDLLDNDTIILYTDGITESKNTKLDDYGDKRLSEIAIESADKTANFIVKKIINDVTVFSSSHSQYDDITLVILKWKQKK
ncbi:MAG TPA: SpoIIE family protein phosphatase [Ignavibacteriaceae bacterium]|nr:SpoIIE family protein phosphatase [Ignavibacteriaceae bacterium]